MAGRQKRRPPKKAGTELRVYRTSCPICKAPVESTDPALDKLFPFCSKRCRLVDLGKWFDGEYHMSHQPQEEEEE